MVITLERRKTQEIDTKFMAPKKTTGGLPNWRTAYAVIMGYAPDTYVPVRFEHKLSSSIRKETMRFDSDGFSDLQSACATIMGYRQR